MSLDSILETMRQGNAFEMELIKRLREGLNEIGGAMLAECYNRSEALGDAKESLENVSMLHTQHKHIG